MATPKDNNEQAMLTEMRDILLVMRESGRRLDTFIEDFASALPDLRTDLALTKQEQLAHRKNIDELYLVVHKGETSLLQQVLTMRQEMKEVMVRTSSYITINEKLVSLENRVKTNETNITSVETAIKEQPKTNRENITLLVAIIGLLISLWSILK